MSNMPTTDEVVVMSLTKEQSYMMSRFLREFSSLKWWFTNVLKGDMVRNRIRMVLEENIGGVFDDVYDFEIINARYVGVSLKGGYVDLCVTVDVLLNKVSGSVPCWFSACHLVSGPQEFDCKISNTMDFAKKQLNEMIPALAYSNENKFLCSKYKIKQIIIPDFKPLFKKCIRRIKEAVNRNIANYNEFVAKKLVAGAKKARANSWWGANLPNLPLVAKDVNVSYKTLSSREYQISVSARLGVEEPDGFLHYCYTGSFDFRIPEDSSVVDMILLVEDLEPYICRELSNALTDIRLTRSAHLKKRGFLTASDASVRDYDIFVKHVNNHISQYPLPKFTPAKRKAGKTVRGIDMIPSQLTVDRIELVISKGDEPKNDMAQIKCYVMDKISSLEACVSTDVTFVDFVKTAPKEYLVLWEEIYANAKGDLEKKILEYAKTYTDLPRYVTKNKLSKIDLICFIKNQDNANEQISLVLNSQSSNDYIINKYRVGLFDDGRLLAAFCENDHRAEDIYLIAQIGHEKTPYDPKSSMPRFLNEMPSYMAYLKKKDAAFRKAVNLKDPQPIRLNLSCALREKETILTVKSCFTNIVFEKEKEKVAETQTIDGRDGSATAAHNDKWYANNVFMKVYGGELRTRKNSEKNTVIEENYQNLPFVERYALYAIQCAMEDSGHHTFSASNIASAVAQRNAYTSLTDNALRRALLSLLRSPMYDDEESKPFAYSKSIKGTYGRFEVYGFSRELIDIGFHIDCAPILAFGEVDSLEDFEHPDAILIDWLSQAKTKKERWVVVEALDKLAQDRGTLAARVLKTDKGQMLLSKLTNDEWAFVDLAMGETNGLKMIIKAERKRREKKHD